MKAELFEQCAKVIDEMMPVLPDLTLPTATRFDLQHSLLNISGFGSLAASVLVKAGREPGEALQVLESCRGIIASLLMDVKSDPVALKDLYPDLWQRYTNCQRRIADLNRKGVFVDPDGDQNYVFRDERQRKLYKQLADLRIEIRQCPGFERFLLAPTVSEMQSMAASGPLVSFNMSDLTVEAFLVTANSIRVLPLPHLKRSLVDRCLRVIRGRGGRAERDADESDSEDGEETHVWDVPAAMMSLWKDAVKPVLMSLNLLHGGTSPDRLPRILWVGCGQMALMPLHAAGDHSQGCTENTFSHVVSSYASTLKALKYLQSKPSMSTTTTGSLHRILIVAMPKTPGIFKPLNVSEEVAAVQTHAAPWATINAPLIQPGKDKVISELKRCTIAHFACHGISEQQDPANSALLLGSDRIERLTVGDLDAISHGPAQLAFLSACSTAEIKTKSLLDEGIHLAGAFQLAGFQYVIGTLWEVDDNTAASIAGGFYARLHNSDTKGGVSVAHALHAEILEYHRKTNTAMNIVQWAPFIHMGY